MLFCMHHHLIGTANRYRYEPYYEIGEHLKLLTWYDSNVRPTGLGKELRLELKSFYIDALLKLLFEQPVALPLCYT